MERVTGIGGLFFAATDADALGRWYAEHLGVDPVPADYGGTVWRQEAGPTVVTGMAAEHLAGMAADGAPRAWAVNFRVRDLAAMVAQLEAAGIVVRVDPEEYPNGVFADLTDPEANAIQLWEPRGAEAEG